MPKANRNTDVAETNSAGTTAATDAATQTNGSSGRGPIWDDVSERVKCAIWKHTQGEKVRYTTAIYRSYRENGVWHNVHYFDRADLRDVMLLAEKAVWQIDKLEGLTD